MTELNITVSDPNEEVVQPYMVWQPVIRARSSVAAKVDAERREQAALLYRALKAAEHNGLAWRECFALTPEVGPVVIWMRSRGVDINAVYDVAGGETRFYLVGGPIANDD